MRTSHISHCTSQTHNKKKRITGQNESHKSNMFEFVSWMDSKGTRESRYPVDHQVRKQIDNSIRPSSFLNDFSKKGTAATDIITLVVSLHPCSAPR